MTEVVTTGRAAVVAIVERALRASPAAAGLRGHIYRARAWPLQLTDLPALLVYAWDETLELIATTGYGLQYRVSCTLSIDARVQDRARDTVAVEADLEALTGAVRRALLTSHELLSTIERINSIRTTLGVTLGESESAIGQGRIAFELQWTETFPFPLHETCNEPELALQVAPSIP